MSLLIKQSLLLSALGSRATWQNTCLKPTECVYGCMFEREKERERKKNRKHHSQRKTNAMTILETIYDNKTLYSDKFPTSNCFTVFLKHVKLFVGGVMLKRCILEIINSNHFRNNHWYLLVNQFLAEIRALKFCFNNNNNIIIMVYLSSQ